DSLAVEGPEGLLDGEEVTERLARVEVVGEAVDDRTGGMGGELLDLGVLEGAQDDGVDVLADGAGEVGDAFALAEGGVAAGEKNAAAAEPQDRRLEGDARPK